MPAHQRSFSPREAQKPTTRPWFAALKVTGSPMQLLLPLNTMRCYIRWKYWQKKGTITLSLLNVNNQGEVDLDQLENLLKAHPKSLVSLMHANNEIGNLNDLDHIGSLSKEYGAFFFTPIRSRLWAILFMI